MDPKDPQVLKAELLALYRAIAFLSFVMTRDEKDPLECAATIRRLLADIARAELPLLEEVRAELLGLIDRQSSRRIEFSNDDFTPLRLEALNRAMDALEQSLEEPTLTQRSIDLLWEVIAIRGLAALLCMPISERICFEERILTYLVVAVTNSGDEAIVRNVLADAIMTAPNSAEAAHNDGASECAVAFQTLLHAYRRKAATTQPS